MGSIRTILLLNNGCSYQDPVLVAILTYFVLFLDETYHFFFTLKKDILVDGNTFRLKSGAFSLVTGRIPALRIAYDWKNW